MTQVCQKLLASALSNWSSIAYRRSWNLFLAWKLQLSLPIPVVEICNDIGHLFIENYSPGPISSHISAICYVHNKTFDLPDQTQSFLTKKILKGCQALGMREDTKLPITAPNPSEMTSALEIRTYCFQVPPQAFAPWSFSFGFQLRGLGLLVSTLVSIECFLHTEYAFVVMSIPSKLI